MLKSARLVQHLCQPLSAKSRLIEIARASYRRLDTYPFNVHIASRRIIDQTSILRADHIRSMSTSAHPVSSTAQPARPAEGLEPITPGASATSASAEGATKPNGGAAKQEGQKQQQPKKDKKEKKSGGGGGSGELNPPPEYFAERIKIFDEYKAKYDKFVAGECVNARGAERYLTVA